MKRGFKTLLVVIFILANIAGKAQLQSDRPMSAIAPIYVKDGSPKVQPQTKELPSEKKMPVVKEPKGITVPKRKTNLPAEPSRLPSNSKTRIKDLVKKPKVKN